MTRALAAPLVLLLAMPAGVAAAQDVFPIEALGDELFEDENLSINRNQSCASCHAADWGGTGPDEVINLFGAVYEGSIPGAFGDRKPPNKEYATLAPIFHFSRRAGGLFVGGNFWDGRATGERLGNPAADQALGPFLNPKEQALPDAACVVWLVTMSDYIDLYVEVWGGNILTINFPGDVATRCSFPGDPVLPGMSAEDQAKVMTEYDNIGLSIAAYEDSPEVNQFSSKFDAWRGGMARMTGLERRGFALFQGKGRCARCHVTSGRDPALTDFSYDNLGVPVNRFNPAFIEDPDFRDPGLGGFLENRGDPEDVWTAELGKMKVPTLRNVDKRPTTDAIKAYTHNGYFKSLEALVHFYNTRDAKPVCAIPNNAFPTEEEALAADCWPAAETPENVNDGELGDLGLSHSEELALVAFIKTLTDGF